MIGCQSDENHENNGTTTPDMGEIECSLAIIVCEICDLEEALCIEGKWECQVNPDITPPDSCKVPCEEDVNFSSIGEACACGGSLACVSGKVDCQGSAESNLCGGCESLPDLALGEACGECGVQECENENAFICVDPGLNACGGCQSIQEILGESCGESPENLWVCDGIEKAKCSLEEGKACLTDDDCFSEHCSFDLCTPKGYSHVKAATYTMGAPLNEVGRHRLRENGQHEVVLTHDLFVKQTTVTQGEYLAITGSNPSYFVNCGENCPVERINFYEMLAYANRLSLSEGLEACYTLDNCTDDKYNAGCPPNVRDGLLCSSRTFVCDSAPLDPALDCNGYRLPTESEWEYFARAGTTSAFLTRSGTISSFSFTPLDVELDQIAWYFGNAFVSYEGGINCTIPTARIDCADIPADQSIGTHPVAQKDPNMWGLYDMTGNVWERVWDISDDYPDPGSSVTDPTGPALVDAPDARARRMRGGPFNAYGQYMRVAYRTGPGAHTRIYNSGFRLVRSLL